MVVYMRKQNIKRTSSSAHLTKASKKKPVPEARVFLSYENKLSCRQPWHLAAATDNHTKDAVFAQAIAHYFGELVHWRGERDLFPDANQHRATGIYTRLRRLRSPAL